MPEPATAPPDGEAIYMLEARLFYLAPAGNTDEVIAAREAAIHAAERELTSRGYTLVRQQLVASERPSPRGRAPLSRCGCEQGLEHTCVPPAPSKCGRVGIGHGTDAWDPVCDLAEGHDGPCNFTGEPAPQRGSGS